MDQDAECPRAGPFGQMPGSEEVDAGVVAAAYSLEGEARVAELFFDCIFVVRADVDGAGFGEANA